MKLTNTIMKKLISVILLSLVPLFLYSCSDKNDDPNTKMDDTARYRAPADEQPSTTNSESQDAKEENTDTAPKDKPLTEKTPEGFKINFPVGATEVLIKGKIAGFEGVPYLMDVSKGQKLTGSVEAISEDGKKQNNIRFSQIFTPSGVADGPFGSTISYDLNETGTWKLIINENQMSGDAWTGEFQMTIGIK